MNVLDLFALGVVPGLGERDPHTGLASFGESELCATLDQLGITRWWKFSYWKNVPPPIPAAR